MNPDSILEAGWDIDRRSPIYQAAGWGLDLEADEDFSYAELISEMMHKEIPVHMKMAVLLPETRSWADARARRIRDMADTNSGRMERKRENQRNFLAAIESGKTIGESLEVTGLSQASYNRWRREDPWFSAEVNRLRSLQRNIADRTGTTMGRVALPRTSVGEFADFRRYYFGYDSPNHHQQMIEAIEGAVPEGLTGIIVPPEAGKTTLITDWVCWKLATDPSVAIAYVSEKGGFGGTASKVLGHVKQRLTQLDYRDRNAPDAKVAEFIARFGPFRDEKLDTDKPWNAQGITISRASARKDYSMEVAGWATAIQGARYDYIIFDDVQSRKSLNLTDSILEHMQSTFFTRLDEGGKMVYIGNRIGHGDIVETLVDQQIFDKLVYIPAMNDAGESYWPERWPLERLEKKRKLVGPKVWAISYMQAPEMAEDATFPPELLDEAKVTDPTAGMIRKPPSNEKVILGLDPALAGGNALVCISVTSERVRVVDAQVDYGLARNEEIYARVEMFADAYSPVEVVIERNAAQRGIARDDRLQDLAARYGFRIVEHETSSNKWDESYGVAMMASTLISGKMEIPWGTDHAIRRMTPLVEQLTAWRPNVSATVLRQDLVMALWFAWLRWKEQQRSQRVSSSVWKTTGVPWRTRQPVGVR